MGVNLIYSVYLSISVQIISVKVAEWQQFGKELFAGYALSVICLHVIVILFISLFGLVIS